MPIFVLLHLFLVLLLLGMDDISLANYEATLLFKWNFQGCSSAIYRTVSFNLKDWFVHYIAPKIRKRIQVILSLHQIILSSFCLSSVLAEAKNCVINFVMYNACITSKSSVRDHCARYFASEVPIIQCRYKAEKFAQQSIYKGVH